MGANAQAPEKALQHFAQTYPQEKVVLSFSKAKYIAGETIYFKAYVLSGYEPSLLSTTLFTELYDKEKKLLQKQLIPLHAGSGNGWFALPAFLAEDVYYIRAYTQWMGNFDEAFFYLKPIPVYNPYSSQSLRPAKVSWLPEATIEGNTLLADVTAHVAVRLTTTGSLPAQWSGRLLEGDSAITSITVYNQEIGQVRFVPREGKSYKLIIQDSSGAEKQLVLPAVQTAGISMQALVNTTHLRYGIVFKNIPGNGSGYKLIAAFNNEPVMVATINKSPGEIAGSFAIGDLPPGILHLTLFDKEGKPVIERLVFLHPHAVEGGNVTLATDTLSFAAKGRNHWRLSADSVLPATLAITVADDALWQPGTFVSDLFFADLTRPAQAGDWYFTDVTMQKVAALDALLVTEKWQRMQWKTILANRMPLIRHQPHAYLAFTGIVRKGDKRQPKRDMNLIIQTADSSVSFFQVQTDSSGSFALNDLYFTDSARVYYQANRRRLFESDLEINFTPANRFFPLSRNLPAFFMEAGTRTKSDTIPLAIQKALIQKTNERLMEEKIKMLEAVVITTRSRSLTQELEKKLASGLFAEGSADVFDFVNHPQTGIGGYTNILEWLQGRVPNFTLSNRGGVWFPEIRNSPVQIFVNEIPAMPDIINTINPLDVALIKVFRTNFAGAVGGGGAIAIYTRRGGLSPLDSGPTIPMAVLQGYQPPSLPLVPDYSQPVIRAVSDERIVLFYSTNQTTSESSNGVSLMFHNNDSARRFSLSVIGFTKNGRLIYLNRKIG